MSTQDQLDREEADRMHLIAFAFIGMSGALIGAGIGAGIALWWMC
jgi:hypothetical protein